MRNRIFAAAIFQIQTVSVGDNIRLLSGSDVFIQAFDWKQPLDEVLLPSLSPSPLFSTVALTHNRAQESMRDFLDTHKKDASSGIIGYTCTQLLPPLALAECLCLGAHSLFVRVLGLGCSLCVQNYRITGDNRDTHIEHGRHPRRFGGT